MHVVVMGVSGSGKTRVGRLLADELARPFVEADDLHPAANVAAMSAGVPLTDELRAPWLVAVRDAMSAHHQAGLDAVVACSALRRGYRDVLRGAAGGARFVHVVVAPDELERRLTHRAGHFMPPSLLASQLATLEDLAPDEDGVAVASGPTPAETARAALAALTGLGE
ncbi:gluconokinase [Cellulomonas composti]|uniref:Gluconokinase n=1 Tax=Cellulomonas composti TaxID=266130 RepID=A0A511JEK8_9CELL|nr:gluconokinase [Cellulomonas composti]GEL96440.1 gluconokinase [Cellulomonas composti]